MSARTVLLATYHFPPSAAVAVYRMLGLARYLPQFGWKVIVVAPPKVACEPTDPELLQLVPPETEVIRIPFPGGLLGKVGWKYTKHLAWAPAAARACADIIRRRRPDVLLTSSPPHCVHYLGLWLHKRFGIPWVASLRDPWVTNRILPLNQWIPWARFMERRVFHSADAIVANTPINLEGMQAAFPHLAPRMTVIPNGFEPALFPPAPERNGLGESLSLLHAGELYSGRDPRPLLDAMAELDMETSPVTPRWDVRFLGRSTEGLCNVAEEIQKRRVLGEQEPQMPYSDALQRMVRSDALLLLHTPTSRVGVPAKLYEYLGAGRPILALAEPDGDIAWVLKTSGVLYRIARPNDTPGILRALRELRDEILRGNDRQARPLHLNPFTRENMARRMAECLDWVVTPPSRRGPLSGGVADQPSQPASDEVVRVALARPFEPAHA